MERRERSGNTPPHKTQKLQPLHQLTRQELEARVQQLEAHNTQLRNLLARNLGGEEAQRARKAKTPRPFDFTKHSRRHVLLKFAYLGWGYQGYAAQEDTQETIEAQLFPALLKTRLIESRETSNYHRCGRTDKGVSAFEQVISITLRSRCRVGVGVEPPRCPPSASTPDLPTPSHTDDPPELNYVQLLNRVLPAEIRMLAWSPVSPGYSSRFDCSCRTYKYFFPRGGLNLEVMREAAQHLLGQHDFRNFCKMDVANGVVSFQRNIRSIRITPLCCDDTRSDTDTSNRSSTAAAQRRKYISSTYSQQQKSESLTRESDKGDEEPSFVSTDEEIDRNLVDDSNEKKIKDQSCRSSIKGISGYESRIYVDQLSKDLSRRDESGSQSLAEENCKSLTVMEHSPHICMHQEEYKNQNIVWLEREGYEMCVATIEGEAFLWHQIRCIMAILLMVGEGKESPGVVAELLDVKKHPRKPQYTMASEVPLNLYGTTFEGVSWQWDDTELYLNITHFQHLWTQHAVRASMISRMLRDLEQRYQYTRNVSHTQASHATNHTQEVNRGGRNSEGETGNKEDEVKEKDELKKESKQEKVSDEKRAGASQKDSQATLPSLPQCQIDCLIQGAKRKVHQPLLSRPTCESLETRVQHYIKRQRLGPEVLQKLTPGAATSDKGSDE